MMSEPVQARLRGGVVRPDHPTHSPGRRLRSNYRGGRASAERVVTEIEAFGGRAVALTADLGDRDAPETLIGEVEAALGAVDILAANHGIAPVAGYDEVDGSDFDELLAINLRAPYLLARRVLPQMREQRWGRILFTSSVAALTGGVIGPHYAASKAGLHGLAHHLATRVAPDGVTVNTIAPALIEDTAMLPGAPADLVGRIPVGRLGRPVEVADLAMAILANGYVTNQTIGIDGGIHPS
jgi:3-oxoacyl-[acyl-carrier protein] reductase